MNRITHCLCLVVALFLSACVGESGVYIASSHGYDKNCKCSSSEQLGGGLLDVSLASQYEVCLLLKNERPPVIPIHFPDHVKEKHT